LALTFWQRLRLRLGGVVYLEHRTRPGWSGSIPFYAKKCPEHGVFEDYPHGYGERLDCPQCAQERRAYIESQVEDVLHG